MSGARGVDGTDLRRASSLHSLDLLLAFSRDGGNLRAALLRDGRDGILTGLLDFGEHFARRSRRTRRNLGVVLGAVEIAFDRRAHLGCPRLRSRSARTCGRRGLLCRCLRGLRRRVGRLCANPRGLSTKSILCACLHRVCGLLQRAVIDSARHLVDSNDVVRHSLDVAALGSAVLRRLIGQTPSGELHGHALTTLQIARDSADLVHVGGHILHVIDVRRYGNDMILHAGDRHNLAGVL